MRPAECLVAICSELQIDPLSGTDPVLAVCRHLVGSAEEEGWVNLDYLQDQFAWFQRELCRAEAAAVRAAKPD